MIRILFFSLLTIFILACKKSQESIPSDNSEEAKWQKSDLWLDYSNEATTFRIWSPEAEEVELKFYKEGNGGTAYQKHALSLKDDGTWELRIEGDLNGVYYTYQVKMENEWLNETPGIYAQAVGVNGQRAMVLDFESTNPQGWANDKGPKLSSPNEAIIYELHIRDLTIHPKSGSSFPGKYLGLVETGTKGPNGVSTGIDHLKELGITHVHLLPTYDHYSINETKLDSAQFNWGYDPQNYNVPEGSFSSDPFNAEVRIKEFKQMVKGFHDNGIGVILDVVYNHTGRTEGSNFNLEYPGYYYRMWEDGRYADASACGNETASEKEKMRQFIIESVLHWADEYHLDGFRFDLMGIHDIETMNRVAEAVKDFDPNIFIYGEGWTAGDSPLPFEKRALKRHILEMPNITAFSDDIRDGLKGSVFEDESKGFVNGEKNMEQVVAFGVVGSIEHPDITDGNLKDAEKPWANEPWQAISYVSCHDNHTIYDKLKVSRKDASEEDIIAMNKLSNAVVMTSQGIAFIHAGAEMLRTKNEEHNSYNLPDSINQIDWNWKVSHANVLDYYKNLISLRKTHPAFRMHTAEEVQKHLRFNKMEDGLVSYQISDYANSDSWKNIYVIYNANTSPVDYPLTGKWKLAVKGNQFDLQGSNQVEDNIKVPPISMAVLFQE